MQAALLRRVQARAKLVIIQACCTVCQTMEWRCMAEASRVSVMGAGRRATREA